MYAPSRQGAQPSVEVSKDFMMSPNKLHLEASLDKEVSKNFTKCLSKIKWINYTQAHTKKVNTWIFLNTAIKFLC